MPALIGNIIGARWIAHSISGASATTPFRVTYQSSADVRSDSSLAGGVPFSAKVHGRKQFIVDSSRHAIDCQLKVLEERC